jgi:hypothetical protein
MMMMMMIMMMMMMVMMMKMLMVSGDPPRDSTFAGTRTATFVTSLQ